MKKYLVLYQSNRSAAEQMQNVTPEQAKAGMDAWMSWAGRAGGAIVDLGSPVGPGTKVTGAGQTTNGSTPVGGYSILQAESREALNKLLDSNHPHFMAPGASIEVFEFLPIPGM